MIPDHYYQNKEPGIEERKQLIKEVFYDMFKRYIGSFLDLLHSEDRDRWNEAYIRAGLNLNRNNIRPLGLIMVRFATIVIYDRMALSRKV
jgi:hypothetical protein